MDKTDKTDKMDNKLNQYSNNIISKTFNSLDKKHQIDIKIIDDVAWFNINKLDYENYKTFLLLIKNIISFLNDKKINTIKQYINEKDLIFFEKSSYVNIGNNQCIVSTDIIHFLSELVNALGIQKL